MKAIIDPNLKLIAKAVATHNAVLGGCSQAEQSSSELVNDLVTDVRKTIQFKRASQVFDLNNNININLN